MLLIIPLIRDNLLNFKQIRYYFSSKNPGVLKTNSRIIVVEKSYLIFLEACYAEIKITAGTLN
jgi:hypothetical protein